MKKIIVILIFINFQSTSYTQLICDSSLVENIINQQLKRIDKSFRRPYNIVKTNSPIEYANKYNLQILNYNLILCDQNLNWLNLNFKSKYGQVAIDSLQRLEYVCYISQPVFNQELNKCLILTITNYSEWGGSGRISFYGKKNKKWKFIESKMLWVN